MAGSGAALYRGTPLWGRISLRSVISIACCFARTEGEVAIDRSKNSLTSTDHYYCSLFAGRHLLPLLAIGPGRLFAANQALEANGSFPSHGVRRNGRWIVRAHGVIWRLIHI